MNLSKTIHTCLLFLVRYFKNHIKLKKRTPFYVMHVIINSFQTLKPRGTIEGYQGVEENGDDFFSSKA